MKALITLILFPLFATLALAQAPFPGLKEVMTESEWKRARLDRLTPDEIGVIDAAIIRHQRLTTSNLLPAITEARKKAEEETVVIAPMPGKAQGWAERMGLPFSGADWRSQPALKAKVVSMEGANRFRLDNNQVWEGQEPITYELVGRSIEIQARPAGNFALIVDGINTTLRVRRIH